MFEPPSASGPTPTPSPKVVPAPPGTPRERLEAVLYELRRVIVGQDRLLDRVLVAVLSRGHVLVEGVPGLAKTLTLESVARVCGGRFSRIQFTPDLVPSDVVGGQVLEPDRRFATRLGPVFANFVLADEINRAPAKVQSALLEVMAEGHASIAGETHPTPRPFFVLATQNPIESEGVYALPEAQLDRFAMKVVVDYPSRSDEEEIVRRMASDPPEPRQLLEPDEILELQGVADTVFVDHRVRAYAVRLVNATREPASEGLGHLAPYLEIGGSPRASLALVRGGRALAVMRGRSYVMPEDVHSLFHDALRHRVILSYEALAADVKPDQVLEAILEAIPQPQVELGSGRAVA
jgi:MoxR-like ATPase